MRIATLWGRFVAGTAFAVLLLWSIPGVAQGQLISADYGAGNRRIDVTDRIRTLVQGGMLNIRVTNETMGVGDPAPGRVKELRMHVREGNRVRDYVMREDTVARLPLDVGGSMGMRRDRDYDGDDDDYNAPVVILQAWYGANSSVANVTQRMRSYLVNGRMGIRVNNESMAIDPAPEQRKALFVLYRDHGQRKAAIIQENGVFAVP